MILMLLALIGLSGLELALFLPPVWKWRKYPSILLLILLAMVNGALVTRLPIAAGLLSLSIALYQLFNIVRIASSTIDARRLHSMTWHTAWWLLIVQTGALLLISLLVWLPISATVLWLLLASAQLIGAMVLLVSTSRQLRKTRPTVLAEAYSDRELPSISVCVPARNETQTLAACLESLLTSNYPKLEIIVLDDCSQDKTSEVIKSYAHQGVRFLHGTVPPEEWLAKNWAYEQLYEAANGEFIVYCGVDIRFEPGSLRAMVSAAIQRKKQMLCLLPQNATPNDMRPRHSTLLQPMRYAWELAVPRRHFNRPPALSSCWLIKRALLRSSGSFMAIRRTIDPERALAQKAIKQDGYSFLQSDEQIMIRSEKTIADQLETAVRMRYPQLRRRPELVWLVSLIELVCLISPLALVLAAALWGQWFIFSLSLLAAAVGNYGYYRIVGLTYRRFLWRGLLALPFAALFDIDLRHYSMWKYEFSDVYWKGRNICLPVMQVVSHLPKID